MLPTHNQKLLDELNAGSKAALETLFRTYYPRLLAFARSYVLKFPTCHFTGFRE